MIGGTLALCQSRERQDRIKIFSFAFEPELLLGAWHRPTVAGARDGDMIDVPGKVRWPQWVNVEADSIADGARPPASVAECSRNHAVGLPGVDAYRRTGYDGVCG